MSVKVLAATVYVQDESGNAVILLPGTAVPKEYAGQITNPACFVEVEDAPAPAVTPAAPAAPAAPATPATPAVPVVPPVADDAVVLAPAGYADATFKELQAEAKRRGLSGQGKQETLLARLAASDREAADTVAEPVTPGEPATPAVETATADPANDQPQF